MNAEIQHACEKEIIAPLALCPYGCHLDNLQERPASLK
jgi:hypothetical protein